MDDPVRSLNLPPFREPQQSAVPTPVHVITATGELTTIERVDDDAPPLTVPSSSLPHLTGAARIRELARLHRLPEK